MAIVFGTQLEDVEEIFGIKRIRSVDVRIAYDECVTAKVEFLMDEVQAKAFLQLFKDGKWRSPRQDESRVETTHLGSERRTYAPAYTNG